MKMSGRFACLVASCLVAAGCGGSTPPKQNAGGQNNGGMQNAGGPNAGGQNAGGGPTLVGRWQAVQGAIAWGYETIDFRADGSLTLTTTGQPIPEAGTYTVQGKTFSGTLKMLQGDRKFSIPILTFNDKLFVLQTNGIGVPRPPDIMYWRTDSEFALRKRLAGVWRGGPVQNQETLAFTTDGIIETDAGMGPTRAVYRIAGKDIEMARVGPNNSIQVVRMGLVSLADAELMLSINNQPIRYTRAK